MDSLPVEKLNVELSKIPEKLENVEAPLRKMTQAQKELNAATQLFGDVMFNAMMDAGTPCPYDGMIGPEAKAAWLANEEKQPDEDTKLGFQPLKDMDEDEKSTVFGTGAVAGLLLLLLL